MWLGDRDISLHAEGEKVVLVEGGQREEVDLSAPGRRVEGDGGTALPEPVAVTAVVPDASDLDEDTGELAPPGTSPLDAGLAALAAMASPPSAAPLPVAPPAAAVPAPFAPAPVEPPAAPPPATTGGAS
jgi:hypothetical protein